MPIRDLLQAQIEQIGQSIGKMISKFLGLKNDGKMEEAIVVTQTVLREELSLDFEKLYRSDHADFIVFFQDKPYSAESLEQLSSYFYEVGFYKMEKDPVDAKLTLQKSVDFNNQLSWKPSWWIRNYLRNVRPLATPPGF